MEGSKTTKINKDISVGFISPEAEDLLNKIMEAWDEFYPKLKKTYQAVGKEYEPTYYNFAYWLVRWSGLVRPNNETE